MKKKFSRIIVTVIALLLNFVCIHGTYAHDFYVDSNHPKANDSNPGTGVSPWLTIQKSANKMVAGDTCYVKAGTYDERVQPRNSGQRNNFITYKAVGTVIMRGFYVDGKTHIRIIGFQITHSSHHPYSGLQLMWAHGCEILDNFIHHTYATGIWLHKKAPSNNVLIRGNTIAYTGCVPGREIGDMAIHITGDNNIVEYNDISHVGDFINIWGKHNIIRNNFFHDLFLSDYPDFKNSEGHHVDGVQYFSDTAGLLTRTLVENNFIQNTNVPHAHLIILQDEQNHGSSELIFRRNVAVRNGSYAVLADYQFDNFRFLHNTLVDMLNLQSPKATQCLQFRRGATGAKILNNIFYNSARSGGELYFVDSSSISGFYADYNLAYLSGSPSQVHGIYKDPRFINYSNNDFHLQSISPAIDAAGPITRTTNSGTGMNIGVTDAGYFTDGWGFAEGDYIRIGTKNFIRITGINYGNNTITVDSNISWNINDPVNLAYQGNGPDMGAYEYRTSGYQYNISIASPANGSTVDSPVQIQANIENEECVRYVIFYVNGIPVAKAEKSPYTYMLNPTGIKRGIYKIEARAHSFYADSILTRSSEIDLIVR